MSPVAFSSNPLSGGIMGMFGTAPTEPAVDCACGPIPGGNPCTGIGMVVGGGIAGKFVGPIPCGGRTDGAGAGGTPDIREIDGPGGAADEFAPGFSCMKQ